MLLKGVVMSVDFSYIFKKEKLKTLFSEVCLLGNLLLNRLNLIPCFSNRALVSYLAYNDHSVFIPKGELFQNYPTDVFYENKHFLYVRLLQY